MHETLLQIPLRRSLVSSYIMSDVQKSIDNIKNELKFLQEQNALSSDLFSQFSNLLSQVKAPRPPESLPTPASSETVEALYDWQGHESTDLSLRKGDRIEILEKTNKDWWRGKCNGVEGLFPSNYVKSASGSGAPTNSSQEFMSAPGGFDEKSSYHPPTNSDVPYGAPPQYGQPPQDEKNFYQPQGGAQNYYGAPAQQPAYGAPQPQGDYYGAAVQQQQYYVPQDQQQQQQQPQGDGHFKKFGKKFGNAAIFGAGATLGSDLINSIF